MTGGERAPWRCRHGIHRWMFVSMEQPREVSAGRGITYVCKLVEECERCGIRFTQNSAPVPGRDIRVSKVRQR